MSALTTHVLDTMRGAPAAGLQLALWRLDGEGRHLIRECKTNADGRTDAPLLDGDLPGGQFELVFRVADYFRAQGVTLPATPFLADVVVRFGINGTEEHLHVPLLVSPYGYSTYRGS